MNQKTKVSKSLLWFSIISMSMVFAGLTSAYIVRRSSGEWIFFDLPNQFFLSAILLLITSLFLNKSYYSLKKDKENTIKYANASLALPDTAEDIKLQLLVNAGDCSVRVGELDKAVDIFTKTLEQTEDDQEKADLHFNLGTVYLKKGDAGEAQYHFEETAYLVPDDKEAIFRLARTLEESQRWRPALNYYKDLIDMDPNNPDYYRGAYRASFNDGDPITANEYLQQAKQLEN